jgi:hypothetical protein
VSYLASVPTSAKVVDAILSYWTSSFPKDSEGLHPTQICTRIFGIVFPHRVKTAFAKTASACDWWWLMRAAGARPKSIDADRHRVLYHGEGSWVSRLSHVPSRLEGGLFVLSLARRTRRRRRRRKNCDIDADAGVVVVVRPACPSLRTSDCLFQVEFRSSGVSISIRSTGTQAATPQHGTGGRRSELGEDDEEGKRQQERRRRRAC